MIIGTCGFGSTGSSVVTDYLKEYDQIKVMDDFEFTWVSKTDGLIDLERAVMDPFSRTGSMVAIRRFQKLAKKVENAYAINGLPRKEFSKIVARFINAITTTKWDWYNEEFTSRYTPKYVLSFIMKKKVIPKAEVKLGHQVKWWPLKEVRISVHPENFYTEASRMVDSMLKAMGVGRSKIIAIDQPFSGNNPQACFPFFKDPYAVVVDRDPRDVYVFAKTKLLGKNHFMAVDPVESFIAYYRALRKDQPYLQPNDRVLRIRFEDMVYEYDKTSAKLREFLKLPENPHPKSIFDPAVSMANTQVFRRYPQYEKEIKKIEKALPEYLFDFSDYPEPDPNAKMFWGKSPLNPGKQRKQ